MLLPVLGTLVASLWLAVISNPRFIDWPLSVLLVYGLLNSLLGSFPMVSLRVNPAPLTVEWSVPKASKWVNPPLEWPLPKVGKWVDPFPLYSESLILYLVIERGNDYLYHSYQVTGTVLSTQWHWASPYKYSWLCHSLTIQRFDWWKTSQVLAMAK